MMRELERRLLESFSDALSRTTVVRSCSPWEERCFNEGGVMMLEGGGDSEESDSMDGVLHVSISTSPLTAVSLRSNSIRSLRL